MLRVIWWHLFQARERSKLHQLGAPGSHALGKGVLQCYLVADHQLV
jgi:hypothetical protein